MGAALEAGVPRIVHVSSVATLHPRADGTPANEEDAVDPEDAIGPYKQSKAAAERLVEALVERESVALVKVGRAPVPAVMATGAFGHLPPALLHAPAVG
jgi:nucleoside-diphosphate-sugar epimerase